MSRNKALRVIRKPVVIRLPWFSVVRVGIDARSRNRVKNLRLPLTTTASLTIKLRRFRTSKNCRSKTQNQFVFKIYFFPVREIAIVKNKHRRHLPKQSNWHNFSNRLGLILVIISIGGSIYFGAHLRIHPVLAISPKTGTTTKQIVSSPLPQIPKVYYHSEPTRMRITKIEIDAAIVPIGLLRNGMIQTPESPNQIGWYDLSPTPGEMGPAIIVGHVDSLRGPAIFWRLRELQAGDIVEIDRADSSTLKFVVDGIKQYPQSDFPTQEIYGDLDYAGIRLITCGGVFDTYTHRYSQNTVVLGSLVP